MWTNFMFNELIDRKWNIYCDAYSIISIFVIYKHVALPVASK